jgi:hypothetical protein
MALFVAVLGTVLGGCGREDYYCDNTGCYYCDGLGCRPAAPPGRQPCNDGTVCPSGQVCTNLGCATPCRANEDCPHGWICRGAGADGGSEGGFCATPGEPMPVPPTCHANADCSGGNVCIDGSCRPSSTPACRTDAECSDGNLCIAGRCTPPANTCQFDNQCGAGRVCVNSECRPRCDSGSCPEGQECISAGSVNYCRDRMTPACMRDSDCGTDQRCVDATCHRACAPNTSSCGPERYCSDDGICVPDTRPRPFCDASRPCQAGSDCVAGVCRVSCSNSMECQRVDVTYRNCGPIPNQSSTRTYCLTDNEFRPLCSRQSECSMGQVCLDGICR